MTTIEQRRKYAKTYYSKHPEKYQESLRRTCEQRKQRYKTDPEFRKHCLEQAKKTYLRDKDRINARKKTPKYRAVLRAYNKSRRLIIKDFILKKKYGISLEQFEEMSKAQNHVCAICGNPQVHGDKWGSPHRRLRVDHDHITGKVRGLLCTSCNLGIGYFQDKPSLLEKSVEYLKR